MVVTDEQATAETPADRGRLVVVFVQADLQPSRISGQLRLRPHTEELLASLPPHDKVAVDRDSPCRKSGIHKWGERAQRGRQSEIVTRAR